MATYRAWNFNRFTHDLIENSFESLSILSVDSISIISSFVRLAGGLFFLGVAYILKLVCKAFGGVDISMELNLDLDVSAISKYLLQTISDLLYLSVLWVFVVGLLVATFLIGALFFLVRVAGIFFRTIESIHIPRRISSVVTTIGYIRGYITSQYTLLVPWMWERKVLDTHSPSKLETYLDNEIHHILKTLIYQRLEGKCACAFHTEYRYDQEEEGGEREENAQSPEYAEAEAEIPQ